MSIGQIFLFVAVFADWSMEYKNIAPMTSVYTRYNKTVAYMTVDKRKQAWSKEKLGSLEEG